MAAISIDQDFLRISKIVRYHRKEAGLSRKQLADIAGVGKTVVYDVEHGKSTVRFETLRKIFIVLNISIALNSPLMDCCNEALNEES